MSTLTTGLPAPLARSLDRVAGVRPAEAGDAAAALDEALAPLRASCWPEVAWRSSTLTATGFPVELAWASRDAALRWTCEVAGPEVPAEQRLSRCADVATRLTGRPLASPACIDAWSRAQRGASLRWGAWVGLRHLDGGRRAKAYVELPADAAVPQPWSATARMVARAVPGLVWRMAGANDDATVELYARVPVPGTGMLAALAGLVGDDEALVERVGELLGPRRPPRGSGLPHPSGISVVMAADGSPRAVTWFAFAKALCSADDLMTAALTRGCGSTPLYAALAAGPPDGRWRHGMVGVGVDEAGATWLQAGLRPS